MKTLVAFVVLLLGCTAQTFADRPYQLNGEGPGMTLEEFKKNHPDAYCGGDTEDADCHVYEGVSFAGVKATSDNSCRDFKPGPNHPIPDYCHAQGMRAEFAGGKMVSLSYGVAKGMLPTVIEALKKQYGKPDEEDSSFASWSNSVSVLTVVRIGTMHHGGPYVDASTFISVTLKSAMPHFIAVPKPKS